ncbi:MAG TPA: hypothetical protein VFO20_15610, partial [Propionibacteriaceae bacterium]|nr:hypothetical protein [Propionibacteriaceae bacterium]
MSRSAWTIRADSEGWVVTWPCGIGTGSSWYAKLTWSGGTKAARGTLRIASSTRESSTPARRAALTSLSNRSTWLPPGRSFFDGTIRFWLRLTGTALPDAKPAA